MNVKLSFILLILVSFGFSVPPVLNNLSLLRQLDRRRKNQHHTPAPATQKYDEHSFMSTYKQSQKRGLQDSEPAASTEYDPNDTFLDLNFETREVTEAIQFIEFKMNEINSLIQECIDSRFKTNLIADVKTVRQECAGASFQILLFNYQESIRKIKEILLELMKIKLEHIQTDHDDEVNFFLDILEQLVDADFSLPETLQIVKQSSQYYVSPRFFDKIISLSKTELQAFHEIHKRLRDARTDLQKSLEAHVQNEGQYVELLEDRGSTYELAFTPKLPTIDRKLKNVARGVSAVDNKDKIKKMAEEKIKEFLRSKEGGALFAGIVQDIKNDPKIVGRPRELLEETKGTELERGDEMGWETWTGAQGGSREDIMGVPVKKPKV